MATSRSLARVLAGLVFAGCSADGPFAPDAEPGPLPVPQMANVAAVADISGQWNWTREEHLTFPDWVAPIIFGVLPEGPTTTARCSLTGVLTVIQTGTSITGSYGAMTSTCVTKGGQPFSVVLGPPEPITGRITGKSVRFETDGFPVDCVHHGTVTDGQGGVAAEIRGGGRCIVPGHPKSDVPGFGPPPAGTEVFTSWVAFRP
jgi:hypothetical protein